MENNEAKSAIMKDLGSLTIDVESDLLYEKIGKADIDYTLKNLTFFL